MAKNTEKAKGKRETLNDESQPAQAEAMKVLQQAQQDSLNRCKGIVTKAIKECEAEGWTLGAEPYLDLGITRAEIKLFPKQK